MAVRSLGLLASFGQKWNASSSTTTSRAVDTHLTCRISKRGCSGKSGEEEEDSADGEAESVATRNPLEQALKELRIHSAAPDWLPFFPGGSFWIHPDQIAGQKPETRSGPLLDPASEGEILAMVMPMGWPTGTAVDDAMSPESGSSK